MTMILKHLYLGDIHDGTNKEYLKTNNIKNIICCLDYDCEKFSNVDYLEFPLEEMCEDKVSEADWKNIFNFIESAKTRNENVLIHCRAGVNRSSFITMGYFKMKYNMTTEQAYNYVKQKRPCVEIMDCYYEILDLI
jgi:protein tyrosine phosphatase